MVVESGSSRLAAALAVGDLVVTADLLPPRSGAPAALADIADQAVCLKGIVTALNVADMPSGMLAQSPWAAASLLAARSLEPIYQMSCRDRGRLALQGDILGAAALGIVNVLCLTGDHPRFGDHPGSRPVFDLSSTELLAACPPTRYLDSRQPPPPTVQWMTDRKPACCPDGHQNVGDPRKAKHIDYPQGGRTQ